MVELIDQIPVLALQVGKHAQQLVIWLAVVPVAPVGALVHEFGQLADVADLQVAPLLDGAQEGLVILDAAVDGGQEVGAGRGGLAAQQYIKHIFSIPSPSINCACYYNLPV